jgi:hypothetical protein
MRSLWNEQGMPHSARFDEIIKGTKMICLNTFSK